VRRVLTVACAAVSLSACAFPTRNPATLHAIRNEAAALMAAHPINPPNDWADVPENQWPVAIASLKPEHVTVHGWGVDILVKPYFDGGWGYAFFKYDAASDTFTPATTADTPPQANDAKCGVACHAIVKKRDSVFTEYGHR